MKYDKIFVIGFNKCATTTIHHLFECNNLKSYHQGTKWKKVNWLDLIDKYQCFSDIKFKPSMIKKLDAKYKNALFILNTRSIEKWIISRFEHGYRAFKKTKSSPYYPKSLNLMQTWIEQRKAYYYFLKNYFKKKQQKLLVLNIEDDQWIHKLVEKLSLKISDIESKNVVNKSSEYENIKNFVYDNISKFDYQELFK